MAHNTEPTKADIVGYLIIGLLMAIALGALVFAWAPEHAHAQDAAIGDSIALGTGRALHVPTYARQGAGSCEILRTMPRTRFTHVVISAGINDGGMCVASIRLNVHAQHVAWILPAPINTGAAEVWKVVKRYGDGFVSYACKGGCSRVNFHPASYAVVAKAVQRAWINH